MLTFQRVIFLAGLIILLHMPASHADAPRGVSGHCAAATSTGDILACVNRHRQDAQIRLNMVFVDLMKSLESEAVQDRLHEAQNAWLIYRDDQCAFERMHAETPALERIVELSCIATLTEARAELLAMALYHRASGKPREFGTFPRWMNVLSHDYPDVFWRYHNSLETDLDCDGQKDMILSGVSIIGNAQNKDAPEVKVVLAVSTNPPTGRPETEILRFPVKTGAGEEYSFCDPAVKIRAGEAQGNTNCSAALFVEDGQCSAFRIIHDGTGYMAAGSAQAGQ
jgi:uncharacterized protein YecT (DUF1311 family)